MTAGQGSITVLFHALKGGDADAAQRLWDEYFRRLVGLARKKLQDSPRRAADEEDVALSAFDSFCRGAERGRFSWLEDRDDLWQLLVVITVRKAADQANHERRLKRGGPGQGGVAQAPSGEGPDLEQVLGREPTPELAALVAEQCQRLLGLLGEEDLRSIALLKMEGYTNEEIAQRLGCARRTVQRRLNLIQDVWQHEAP